MRGEDLLDERRARARESHDEYGTRSLASPAATCGEELRGEGLFYDAGVVPDARRPVARLGLLQRVAALVVAERPLVLPAVFECLAERKAQVIVVGRLDSGARFLGAHGRDLLIREGVFLQIGEAPVGLAVARPDGGC